MSGKPDDKDQPKIARYCCDFFGLHVHRYELGDGEVAFEPEDILLMRGHWKHLEKHIDEVANPGTKEPEARKLQQMLKPDELGAMIRDFRKAQLKRQYLQEAMGEGKQKLIEFLSNLTGIPFEKEDDCDEDEMSAAQRAKMN